MRQFLFVLIIAAVGFCQPNLLLGQLWLDDFESTAPTQGIRSAPNHTNTTDGTLFANNQYFVRTNDPGDGTLFPANGFNAVVANIQNDFYWRGEDIDFGGSGTDPDVINWTGIDITGFTNLTFSGFFGARNNQPFESGDEIKIEADTGSGFSTVLLFQGDGSGAGGTGNLEEVSTNTILDHTLSSFTGNIAGTGTTLSLRLTATDIDGSEEIFFDHFTVRGVPEPSSFLMVGLAFCGGLARRRKK